MSKLNIQEALKKYSSIEIELLLAHVLKKSKEFLFMNPEIKLTRIQGYKLLSMIRRRQKGEPIAYILGYKDFYGLRFKVNKHVLIPRPETEQIIERLKDLRLKDFGKTNVIASAAKQSLNQKKIASSSVKALSPRNDIVKGGDDALTILDIGTGSGCIAVSLAKECAKIPFAHFASMSKGNLCTVYASDISSAALKVAKENAKILLPSPHSHTSKYRSEVCFVKSDLLENIKFVPDIIVANLPYVPKKNYELRIKNLGWEPKLALVDKKKDFDIYERLFKQIATPPSLPKIVYLEIDPKQKILLPKIIKKYLPKADIKFYKDLNGLWRFVEVKLPGNS